MLDAETLLNGLPPELVLHFFAAFARFEFALKDVRCLVHTEDGAVAMASRRKLAARLGSGFFLSVHQGGIAPTLIARPPKNLQVHGGGLAFSEQPPPLQTTLELMDAVWDVRNNLFHGNKSHPGDRERDTALIADTLRVIDALLEADPAIREAFNLPQQDF